ncbi:hypothetical protein L6R49_23775 [Myxococcota bacterium]|nr:hypothetical protein [Myxococcota bacterium]
MSFWSSVTQTLRRVFGGDAPGAAPPVAPGPAVEPSTPPAAPADAGVGAVSPQAATMAVEVEDDDDDEPPAAQAGGDELELELEDEEERPPLTPPVVAAPSAPSSPRWSPQPGPRPTATAPGRQSPAEREDNELTELEVGRAKRNPAFAAALGGGLQDDLDPRGRHRPPSSLMMPTAAYDDEDEDNRPTVIDQVVDFQDEPATDVDVFGTSRAAGISTAHRPVLPDDHDEDRATFADYIDDAPAARVITNDYAEDEDAGAFDSGELDVGIYARALGAAAAPPAPQQANVELDDEDLDEDDEDDDDDLIAPSAVTTFRPRLEPSPMTRDADEDPVTYDEELFSHQDLARTRTAAKAPPPRKQAQAWSPEQAKARPAARPAGAPSMSHSSAPTLVPDMLDDLDDLELETEEIPEDAAPLVAPTPLPESTAPSTPLAPLEESDEHTDFAVEDFSWTEDPDPPAAPAPMVERYRNSLNIPDSEVMRVLRGQHFPSASAAPDDLLHQLARVESELLDASASLGHRFSRLIDRVSRQNELWQSAVWWSGVHGDRRVRESLTALRDQGDEPSARALAWAARPYLSELIEAAGGARDDARIVEAHGAVEALLGQRRALARTAPPELRADLKRLPTEPRGLDGMPGFRWLG